MQQKKIRVLETIRQGKIGGGESHVLDLVANLDKEQYEPVVLSFTDGPMIQALEKMQIPAHVIASEKPFDISVWKRVKQLLIDERIDLVHVHGTRANTNVLWAARNLKLPVIYTVHGWSFHGGLHPLMKKARIAAEKFITSRAQVNICVSESNRQTGQKAFGKLDAVVVPNGVNLQRFDPQANYADVKKAYGIPEDHLVVGYIVRMTYQKDPVSMIHAFAEVHKLMPNMTLLMVGEGELKQTAIDTANALGLSDYIVFDNFRQDVPAVLNAVDIYCLPSLWEGFPIGVLEAMAMGKAVIASDVDGTREAVRHEENGLLVPAKNVTALANAIMQLASDVALRERLAQSARNTILAEYNVAGMTRKIEAVYRDLIGTTAKAI
ncbi:glycosyltransferase family 4 protein [Chitinophaga pendula]|uniref:glycosyltransferase family 4 protein n=1 Tax=Chitinophaga TaxID=79328 RepID=UPI000BAE7E49|nr:MULTISPECIES: glycosyltransferase family 4 protein [Chitinophaga]ASZ13143.1 group 1 glycosyl transferase [Chitinophaga sp. MD30]UCJ09232.1 glycosyltransferase family 4 protein [Chitinophaga pendula]